MSKNRPSISYVRLIRNINFIRAWSRDNQIKEWMDQVLSRILIKKNKNNLKKLRGYKGTPSQE